MNPSGLILKAPDDHFHILQFFHRLAVKEPEVNVHRHRDMTDRGRRRGESGREDHVFRIGGNAVETRAVHGIGIPPEIMGTQVGFECKFLNRRAIFEFLFRGPDSIVQVG